MLNVWIADVGILGCGGKWTDESWWKFDEKGRNCETHVWAYSVSWWGTFVIYFFTINNLYMLILKLVGKLKIVKLKMWLFIWNHSMLLL